MQIRNLERWIRVNTIIYLGSSKAIHDFDWMQEENILHKQVKENLTEIEFSNLVKTDLRNANLDYLIIDTRILEKSTLDSYRQGIETFQVLNPGCQVILYANEEITVQEKLQGVVVINEPEQAFLLPEQKDIPGQIVEKEQTDIPEKNINIEEEQEKVSEESINTEPATDILNDSINEISESEGFTEPTQVPDEENSLDIFSRMNVKVKTSEGIPLKERCLEQQKVTEKENIQLSNNLTTLNNIWTCSNVIIAVTGSQRRTGATTVAMRLCDYLNKNGAHVCYSEATLEVNEHLSNIAEEFNFDVVEASYRKKNITYYRDSTYDTEAGYNFIVLDLGAVEERPKWITSVIEKVADEVILVASGARNYEVESLKRSLEVFSGIPVRINVVINTMSESRFKVFTEQNEDDRVQFHRGECETGFFNTTRVEEELAVLLKAHNV